MWGISNFSAWHLMKALGVAERKNFVQLVSQQIHYSLHAREAEYELVPLALDQGIGILVWSPLAGGLLSGKYRRGAKPPAGSRLLTEWNEPPVPDEDKLYDIVDVLVEIGEARGVSAAQVALSWTMARPAVSTVIIGARTSEQLADNLAAAELVLTGDETSPARGGEPPRAALSLLASGRQRRQAPEPRRSVAAGAPPVASHHENPPRRRRRSGRRHREDRRPTVLLRADHRQRLRPRPGRAHHRLDRGEHRIRRRSSSLPKIDASDPETVASVAREHRQPT